MAKLGGVGKRGIEAFGLFLPIPAITPLVGGDVFGVHRLSGQGVSVAKPLREIAVLAPL